MEARLARLERYLGFTPTGGQAAQPDQSAPAGARALPSVETRETALEMQIGEFWLARIGILALLLGLGFLITYPFTTWPTFVPCLIGYLAVAGLFTLARYGLTAYRHLSRIVFGGALVLLYFATLRLHFFSSRPVLASSTLALTLLVVVLAIQFFLAVKRQSQFMAGLVTLLGLATCLLSPSPHFALGLVVATALVTVGLLKQYNWQALANLTIVLAYTTHLLWLFARPLGGQAAQPPAEPQWHFFYLLLYAGVFASANCFHYQTTATTAARIVRSVANGAGLFVLGSLIGLTGDRPHLVLLELAMHAFFMGIATLYWLHRHSRYSTSIYSCFGYLALSAAIFAHFQAPDYFVWLGWQSLLVAATAVWFGSKIIVVTNVFIYLGIYAAYLVTAPASGLVNLSYALIALITARILNWQQARLEIRTERLRNIYLGAAGVIVPYGLYHAVPANWVSVSWLGAAVVYFLMSLVLRNKKYRWLAIGTIFATAVYAVTFDLARLEPGFRIVSFLALGVVLLLVSLFYARYRKRVRQAT